MKKGLDTNEVIKARKKYGNNQITVSERDNFLKLLIASLGDPIIKILLIALAIKTLFLFQDFDWYETIGIVIAIFLASFISSISEYGSEKAFDKLQEDASKIMTKVIRNNKLDEVEIGNVVVGDIIHLEAGDQIPADGKLIKGTISVNESNLNGETKEITKKRDSALYRSSVVYNGEGYMEVEKVGDHTLYGNLAKEASEKNPTSPLKIRLTHLAGQISKLGYIGAALVTLSYLFSVIVIDNKFDSELIMNTLSNFPLMFAYLLHALTLSVTIIVVAVPEGLPMMITLVLSSNMKRMLKSNVLVRKLMGIETAGNINILFTDKTGTITKGHLEVVGIVDPNGKTYYDEETLKKNKPFYKMVRLSLTGNNASTYSEGKAIGGNITDRALLKFFTGKMDITKLDTIPFSSERKFMCSKVKHNGKEYNLIKGAPEVILKRCSHYYEGNIKKGFFHSQKLKKQINEITKKGIRVLAYATADSYSRFDRLSLVGLVYIKDEVRPSAIEGLTLIKNAGVNTIMITGDNLETAKAIGAEVGLIKSNNDLVLSSEDLNKLSDEGLKKILSNIKVIARALPNDKSRLVKISREMGYVVGMTGDGVNDAPALKKADVGFAMGSGTEVAKEASDIIILDDNLLSISNAILYGRTIFKSIRKFIIFQLTVNLCAVSISIIGPFIGVDTPVTVIQMLWINMVMDTLAGIAFSYEPALKEYMHEKPKTKNEMIINKYMLGEILITGGLSALLCIFFLKFSPIYNVYGNDKTFLTAFFGLFIFISIFNSFNARTHRLNLLSNILKNKAFLLVIIFIIIVQVSLIYYGGDMFRTYGLTLWQFEFMLILSFLVVPIDFIRKLYLRKKDIIGGV